MGVHMHGYVNGCVYEYACVNVFMGMRVEMCLDRIAGIRVHACACAPYVFVDTYGVHVHVDETGSWECIDCE